MYKPIIENDSINFRNLFDFLILNILKIIPFYFTALLIFTINFFTATPDYSSKISFYTNYNDSKGSSFLSPILNNLGGSSLAGAGLSFSITNYLSSDIFLEDIVTKKYKIGNTEQTLVEYWGPGWNNYKMLNPIAIAFKINQNIMINSNLTDIERKTKHAKLILNSKVSLSQDRKSDLQTVTVTTRYFPSLSEQILNEIYNSIIRYSNEINSAKAQEKISFISVRLLEINKELEDAENKLSDFLEKNKVLASPNLSLKKERLEREISIHAQVYATLSDQLELAKINKHDNTSTIFLLDKPNTPHYKEGWSLIKGIVYIAVMCLLVFYAYIFYINRKDLVKL